MLPITGGEDRHMGVGYIQHSHNNKYVLDLLFLFIVIFDLNMTYAMHTLLRL